MHRLRSDKISASMMASDLSIIKDSPRPNRRNGKQQACEPCRIAKLRCDHTSPVCARCQRRGLKSSCSYHPSPMTGRVSVIDMPKSPRRFSKQRELSASNEIVRKLEVSQGVDDHYGIFFSNAEQLTKVHAGFLGPTSYSAIFSEHQANFGVDLDDWSDLSSDAFRLPEMPEHSSPSRRLSFTNLGVRALKQLPSEKMCELLITRFFVCVDFMSLHEPTIRYAHKSFWSTYGDSLKEPRQVEKLLEISRELCQNGKSLLVASRTATPYEWWACFTGHQYRWEMVGKSFC